MRKIAFVSLFFASLLIGVPSHAENLKAREASWLATGGGNSLEEETGLFGFINGSIVTESDDSNVHLHYLKGSLSRISNYTFSGQVYIADEDGGIGVTFHSDYPNSDTYYRLRRYWGEPDFHIAPHPDDIQQITDGRSDMGLGPQAERWFNFKIMVRTSRKKTRIRARAWRDDVKEPKVWLIDCSDASSIHLKRGRLGLWSSGPGLKAWRKLKVTLLSQAKTKG